MKLHEIYNKLTESGYKMHPRLKHRLGRGWALMLPTGGDEAVLHHTEIPEDLAAEIMMACAMSHHMECTAYDYLLQSVEIEAE